MFVIENIGFNVRVDDNQISRNEFDTFSKFIFNEIANSRIINIDSGVIHTQKNILLFLVKVGLVDSKRIEKYMIKENIHNGFFLLLNYNYKIFWEGIQTTRLKIIMKGIDILIKVNFVTYDNLSTIMNLIDFLLNKYIKTRKNIPISKNSYTKASKLSVLLATDPILYKFKLLGDKKKYFSPYSMRCQKEHQPEIYSEKEFNELKKSNTRDISKIVKYFNHTTGEPLYYLCPINYPYFSPIIGKHPESRCMGCCQKTASNIGWKEYVLNQCLDTGQVTVQDIKKIKNEYNIPNIRHIVNYNKTFDPGRVYKLPDNISLKLNQFAGNNIFYIYAVETDIHGLNLGLYYALTMSLDITNHKDYFDNILKKIRKMPILEKNMFFLLATLTEDKNSVENLINNLSDVILNKSLTAVNAIKNRLSNIDFFIITLFRFTHDLNIIRIVDSKIRFYEVNSYRNLQRNFNGSKYTVVIQKTITSKQMGVMFYAGSDIRKAELFVRKIFYHDDPFITVFHKIINIVSVPKFQFMTASDLQTAGYDVKHIHVDGEGFCFGANIGFYIPMIPYLNEPIFKKVYNLPTREDIPTLNQIQKFIDTFNKNIKKDSKKIYPEIWFSTTKNRNDRFGILINKRLWFFKKYIDNNPWNKLPQVIREITLENANIILKNNFRTNISIDNDLYNEYLLEDKFIHIVSHQIKKNFRNKTIRDKVTELFDKKTKNLLQNILILADNKKDMLLLIDLYDYNKLTKENFNRMVFNFDMNYAKEEFYKIKGETFLCAELRKYTRQFVKYQKIKKTITMIN